MTIKEGDRLPAATLQELPVEYRVGCPTGAENRNTAELTKGKRVAIFAVPGAFTRTCSARHLPGFVEAADQLKAKKVDEIWCVS